jgi:hypothetical protein
MWNYVDQSSDSIYLSLPPDRSIFLVRKWVGRSKNGVISFAARSPEAHMKALSLDVEFEPDVGVVIGHINNGKFYDENGFEDSTFEADSILAWTAIPGEFFNEGAARQVTESLLARVSNG